MAIQTNNPGSDIHMLGYLRAPNGRDGSVPVLNWPLRTILRWAGFLAVIAYLAFQLTRIGWAEIFANLPASPLFYILSIGFVLVPVFAEVAAFRLITGNPAPGAFKLFLRKHVLNKAVINFSGDAYVVQRLSKAGSMTLRQAAILMKDMTLIRAFIANFWIIGLGIATVMAGRYAILQNIAEASPLLVLAVAALSLTVCGGAILLFRKLTRMTPLIASKVAGVYLIRSFVIASILLCQWSLAIPGTAMSTWLIFLILYYVTKKSPVAGELVFASVVITLPGLGADNAAIAAMLISIAAIAQLLYLLAFMATSSMSKDDHLA